LNRLDLHEDRIFELETEIIILTAKKQNITIDLKKLRILMLDSNSLKSLPDSFQNLINLEELELNRNDFTSLPDWFGNLKNLKNLPTNPANSDILKR